MAIISINGTALPAPTTYKYDVEPIGVFERNAAGRMVGDKIGDKIKISCSWLMLPGEHYAAIIDSVKEFFINVTFTAPNGVQVTKEMYTSPQSGTLKLIEGDGFWYQNVTCNFIER